MSQAKTAAHTISILLIHSLVRFAVCPCLQIESADHRPKNILFKQGGFEGMLKLTDFGLSKGLDTRDFDQTFTTPF